MSTLTSRVSPRARAFLESSGLKQKKKAAKEESIRTGYARKCPARLVDALVAFEATYAGLVIDPRGVKLELGLGALEARRVKPEIIDQKLVLVGTEADADIYLDERGWLWSSGPDRVQGEMATSVERYVERLAVGGIEPSKNPYFLYGDPEIAGAVKTLGLKVDEIASDEVFTFASSERYVLRARTKGTPWLVGRMTLSCADFGALFDALTAMANAYPTWRCSIATGHSTLESDDVQTKEPPTGASKEKELSAHSTVRIASVDGGAVHLLDDGSIATYTLNEDGNLTEQMSISRDGGKHTAFFEPWD